MIVIRSYNNDKVTFSMVNEHNWARNVDNNGFEIQFPPQQTYVYLTW